MADRLLIKDGCVLTLDPALGDFDRADVLIEDGRIAAVRPDLDAADAEVIDASGRIVMPGFVDTHRHTWQTALRGICADWTLLDYFRGIRLNASTVFGPEDMYAGNYVGALEALDAGVTTVLDFSHCNNTPDHADEAVRGLKQAGLRACSPTASIRCRCPSHISPTTRPASPTRAACANSTSLPTGSFRWASR